MGASNMMIGAFGQQEEVSMTAYPPFHEQLRHERERHNLSQADLAKKVGCDPKTVRRWENGETLPRSYHRQVICDIFKKSPEEFGLIEEIQNANPEPVSSPPARVEQKPSPLSAETATASAGNSSLLRSDWDEAPHVTHVHGREREREVLAGWLEDRACRVVAIVGMGGIGKTTLATVVARETEGKFAAVFWRSLHNVPPLEPVLQQCLRAISAQPLNDLPGSVEEQIVALIEALRRHRCLLVLDNVESILQGGRPSGQYRTGYEMYRELIRRIAETQHQSCLLLTSREKPQEVARFAGQQSSVRSLELTGLEDVAGRELLSDRQLSGSDDEWAELVGRYRGNPLALQLVAEPIRQVFGGKIASFLHTEASAFGGINELLAQQFQRLSQEERAIMYWLAIEREPVLMEEIGTQLAQPLSTGTLVEMLDSLRRRSMIESRSEGHFALQPVILEYVTDRLVEQACQEFSDTGGGLWVSHALMKASSKDYVRTNQLRLLLAPVAQRLEAALGKKGVERTAISMLAAQRQQRALQPGYLAGNLLNLLSYMQCNLRDFDFSHLVIRQACLQQVPLPGVNFSHAHFVDTTFTSAFGNVLSVACDPRGELFAVGTTTGDIRVYRLLQGIPTLTCSGHSDGVWSVAFSPDGKLLASSSDDHTVRLWDASTGDCIAILSDHDDRIRAVAFSPDGKLLASGSDDHTIRLWDAGSGQCLKTLRGHSDRVWSVAFNPDGNVLASGSTDQTICLWDWQTGSILTTLKGHSGWIRSVKFHPDGRLLASGSDDQTVRLWDTRSGDSRAIPGHSSRVWSVAFDPDGKTLASSSEDQAIRLWDTANGECLKILQGHVHGVRSIAFSPQDHILVSGGDDQSCRIWNADTGYCLDRLQGYTNRIWSLAFSPDGRQLASASEDQKLLLWDVEGGQRPRTLTDNTHGALILAFSPDGQTIASGGQDETIRLWDVHNGRNLNTLRGHSNWIRALAFSPGGNLLASGSEDYTICIWHVRRGQQLCKLEGHGSWVRSVAFCPDSTQLASGGDDQCVRIWDVESGNSLKTLRGHTSRVRSVAFSSDGNLLASAGEDQVIRLWEASSGECTGVLEGHAGWVRWIAFNPDSRLLVSGSEDQTVRLWDVGSKGCLYTMRGHASRVRCVAFSPRGTIFASSGDDGTIKLWDTQSGTSRKTLISGRPYEGMNIIDARGLTEAQRAALLALGAIENDQQ
jgi:WD40 repeat protein/transcriptional regulator with XRE-family HTH domain